MASTEELPKMEYRLLGRSGLKVSAISLGGWLTYGGHVENGTCALPQILKKIPTLTMYHRIRIRLHESRI